MGQLAYSEEVIGNARHDMSGLGIVEILERKLLQMTKQIRSHRRLNPGAQDVSPLHIDVVANRHQHNEKAHQSDT